MIQVAFAKEYFLELPDGHRFPMEKYDLLPQQLLFEGTLVEQNFFQPIELKDEIITETHSPLFLADLNTGNISPKAQRLIGFPYSKEMVYREKIIMEGTRRCAELAFENKVCLNIAGGTHHSFYDRGEGFCILNDQAIAANWLIKNNLARKILIVDLDVHQGNGTASLFEQNPNVFTFSMHGQHNYPIRKEKSDLDIGLPDGIKDEAYLMLLKKSFDTILDQFAPDFIFYQCGVDIISTDKLGRLGVSLQGCKQRDRYVFDVVKQLNIPVVCSMGGGYSPQIKDILEAHANTFRVAQDYFG
jgi:acetoin utilization deacetylase AcuC-like enzyme